MRIGNNAIRQVQNDVYGQVLVSLLPLFIDGRLNFFDNRMAIHITEWLLGKIEEFMDSPDSGLWEFKESIHYYCYTYLFHWAGAKAAEKLGRHMNEGSISEKGKFLAQRAASYIENCYCPDKAAYCQSAGGKNLDASSLQLITMKYLDPEGEKAINHLRAHERELFSGEGRYYRYLMDDIG